MKKNNTPEAFTPAPADLTQSEFNKIVKEAAENRSPRIFHSGGAPADEQNHYCKCGRPDADKIGVCQNCGNPVTLLSGYTAPADEGGKTEAVKEEIKEGDYIYGKIDDDLSITGFVEIENGDLVVVEDDTEMTISLTKLSHKKIILPCSLNDEQPDNGIPFPANKIYCICNAAGPSNCPVHKNYNTYTGKQKNDEQGSVEGEKTYRWVKASERLPLDRMNKYVSVDGFKNIACYNKHHNMFETVDAEFIPLDQIEWLEKIPAPDNKKNDPLKSDFWKAMTGEEDEQEGVHEKSLRLLAKFIKEQPEEAERLKRKAAALDIDGPTLQEYFNSFGYAAVPSALPVVSAQKISAEETDDWFLKILEENKTVAKKEWIGETGNETPQQAVVETYEDLILLYKTGLSTRAQLKESESRQQSSTRYPQAEEWWEKSKNVHIRSFGITGDHEFEIESISKEKFLEYAAQFQKTGEG